MPRIIRVGLLFAVAVVAMGAAYYAGFATAGRLRGSVRADALEPVLSRVVDRGHTTSPKPLPTPAEVSSAITDAVRAEDVDPGGEQADFDLFWEALGVVEGSVGDDMPAPEEITYGAIRGSLRSLDDPFTLFSDPVDTAVQSPELAGEFEGIGAYVTSTPDGRLKIQTPMRGQPAEKAGILSGDIVIKVDDRDITDLDVSEAVLLIRGPKGTTVRLTILREGEAEPLTISVVRDRIEIPSVNGVTLLAERGAPQVGYLELTTFAAETHEELVEAIDELLDSGAEAIVLDLRNNPGGFLNTAIDVASEFIDSGVIVFQEDSDGKRTAMEARRGGRATDVPLVVLINKGSASASEIVAGAIRDHGRGTLVGQTTYGKGSVQNVHKLSDGSELRVTVAVWRTPNGTLIHKEGIRPDIEVLPEKSNADLSDEDGVAGQATSEAAATPTADVAGADDAPPADDPQLERAIAEALRMLGAERP